MTLQAPPSAASSSGEPGRQIASLRETLILVRSICGEDERERPEVLLEEAAWFSEAYERASPVVQRRFAAMSAEAAAWAAAGVEALLAAGHRPPAAPARCLAAALEDSLRRLKLLLES